MNVLGTDSLFAPMKEFVLSKCNQVLIECRPTTPDIEVKLISVRIQHMIAAKWTYNVLQNQNKII